MSEPEDPLEKHQNMPLFDRPLNEGPKARRDDPETSHEAADAMRGTKRLGRLQEIALEIVRRFPGITAGGICRASGEDWETIIPRLAPLRRLGFIKNLPVEHPARKVVDEKSGRRQLTWWPHLKNDSRKI